MEQISNTKYTARPDTICLEGNGYRPSHRGDGYIESDVMYTLNSTEVHAVCYAIGGYEFQQLGNTVVEMVQC